MVFPPLIVAVGFLFPVMLRFRFDKQLIKGVRPVPVVKNHRKDIPLLLLRKICLLANRRHKTGVKLIERGRTGKVSYFTKNLQIYEQKKIFDNA